MLRLQNNLATAMAFASGRRAHHASLRSRCRDAEAISLEANFDSTRVVATARATLDPANLRRQFALVPWDLIAASCTGTGVGFPKGTPT